MTSKKPSFTSLALLLAVLVAGISVGCSSAPPKSPAIADGIRSSLDTANLKDVSVSQDRDKGLVTLGGHVTSDADKAQAETIAKSLAGTQVVANQIAVLPPGSEGVAKDVNSALDEAIEKNLDAALIQHRLQKAVKYSVKNAVVTLTGEVRSQARRDQLQSLASEVPNVKQVVNELQIKDLKASSTK